MGRPLGDDFASFDAGARAEIDQVIGGADEHGVVFDNDHGVALFAQSGEGFQESSDFGGVQAAGRLVDQDGERGEAAAEESGQLDALCLAGGEGAGRSIEVEVTEADLDEEAQATSGDIQRGTGQSPFAVGDG